MRLLLDTHILLAVIDGRGSLFEARVRALLEHPEAEFAASVASLWEIAIKWRLGKLALSVPIEKLSRAVEMFEIELFPILASHVVADIGQEPMTRDPFDRLLLAQCAVEDLRLVTIDRALIDHPLSALGD